jgi:hypothetical protein
MIPNPCIEVHTSPVDRPSVPPWFAEVVIIAHHLRTKGRMSAFAHQVRLVRGLLAQRISPSIFWLC